MVAKFDLIKHNFFSFFILLILNIELTLVNLIKLQRNRLALVWSITLNSLKMSFLF